MSEPETIETPPPRPIEPAFGPLAVWTAASFGLLVLATMGPKLWATQPGENATIAVEIVGIGQGLLAAILWPIWTRTPTSAIGVVLSSPAWLFLAGRIADAAVTVAGGAAWKVAALLIGLALIRLFIPRGAVGFAWALVVALALGAPALWMLQRGG